MLVARECMPSAVVFAAFSWALVPRFQDLTSLRALLMLLVLVAERSLFNLDVAGLSSTSASLSETGISE